MVARGFWGQVDVTLVVNFKSRCLNFCLLRADVVVYLMANRTSAFINRDFCCTSLPLFLRRPEDTHYCIIEQ